MAGDDRSGTGDAGRVILQGPAPGHVRVVAEADLRVTRVLQGRAGNAADVEESGSP